MRAAVIVAHGTPSAPDEAERWIRALAGRVTALAHGIDVHGATLAAPGALERVFAGIGDPCPIIYPMFMADGWFVRQAIPARLAEAGIERATIADPFGRDPRLPALCRDAAAAAARERGWQPRDTALVVAAHGSPSDPRPREVALGLTRFLGDCEIFRSVTCGFIDERPYLSEVAHTGTPALCLPFFAARGGHVTTDIPAMLDAAGFGGDTMDPVGVRDETPGLIAAAIRAHAARLRVGDDADGVEALLIL